MTDVMQQPKTPLAAGSVQVGGTKALSITVEAIQDRAVVGGEEFIDTNHKDAAAESAVAEVHVCSGQGDMVSEMSAECGSEAGSTEFVAPIEAAHAVTPVQDRLEVADSPEIPVIPSPGVVASQLTSASEAMEETASVEAPASEWAYTHGDTLGLLEQASQCFTAVLQGAGFGAAKLSFSLMKFSQDNVQNNLDLAQSCVAVRSLPDFIELHNAYAKKQIDLIISQVSTLQRLSAEMASNASAHLKISA